MSNKRMHTYVRRLHNNYCFSRTHVIYCIVFGFQNVLKVDMESIVNHSAIHVSTKYVIDLTEIVHMAALTGLEEMVVT